MAQFLPPPEHVTGPVPRGAESPRPHGAESSREKDVPSLSLHSPREVIGPLRPFRIRPSSEEDPHAAPPSLFSRPALPAVPPCLVLPCA